MSLPNNGWLPIPLNNEITQFTLPEEYEVYYYVCNPGPYDPLQPWQKPVIEYIRINQNPFADAGFKHGAWGWVAGIHWPWAYGDALIDGVWPPDEPTTFDEYCPGNDDVTDDASTVTTVETEVCPPESTIVADTQTTIVLQPMNPQEVVVTEDTRVNVTFTEDRT